MADREKDRQQQGKRPDLDRHDRALPRCAEHEREKTRQAEESETQCCETRQGVAILPLVPAQHAAERAQGHEPAAEHQREPRDQHGLQVQQADVRKQIAAKHAGKDRHIRALGQGRLSHPAREHGEQEAEDEHRQHAVLREHGVRPTGIDRRGRKGVAEVSGAEETRPPRHGDEQRGGAAEEHHAVRRGGEDARQIGERRKAGRGGACRSCRMPGSGWEGSRSNARIHEPDASVNLRAPACSVADSLALTCVR